jgi:hypothetical protein
MQTSSLLLQNIAERQANFKPNAELDSLIAQLRNLIEPVQAACNGNFEKPSKPVLGIVGAPRVGTTIASQLLAATGAFTYPTNFLSRFAYAPMIGAIIQRMLFEPKFDLHEELHDIQTKPSSSSFLGKTVGALDVNEFYHFWRRFFPVYEPGFLTKQQLQGVQVEKLRAEIASVEDVFEKPFMSKAKMIQHNIDFFAKRLPEVVFIYIKRQPRYAMQSILMSRRRYYGNDTLWWSVKPRHYNELVTMNPFQQIAGQVYCTDCDIESALSSLDDHRKLEVTYESICEDTAGFLSQVRECVKEHGVELKCTDPPFSITCANEIKISVDEVNQMEKAYQGFVSGDIRLEK